MNITKIKIKNLFGITETELDGRSIELKGKNGIGKTSVIDSIRLALTNASDRAVVVKNGETEGEILIETDSSLSILRKKRIGQIDYKLIKEDNKTVMSPEKYLSEIFTPLQLNPVEFTQMSIPEQNKAILNLIEFDWDLDYIQDKFGEIPSNVNYKQHILKVLEEIQSKDGAYYLKRQDINRDVKIKEGSCADIVKAIPKDYNSEHWRNYKFEEKYQELNEKKDRNNKVERAKAFANAYETKHAAIKAVRNDAIQLEKDLVNDERNQLNRNIDRMRAEIKAAEERIKGLDEKLDDKIIIATSEYETALANLNKDNIIAEKYASVKIEPTEELEEELRNAQSMIKHLNEYDRMIRLKEQSEHLKEKANKLTEKIELARTLPAEILKTARIPLKNLTVENGVPLINGLPISNLSTGEQIELCVDIAVCKPGTLKIMLIDEISVLDTTNREKIYEKCRANGLQFIATRPSDSDELEIVYL